MHNTKNTKTAKTCIKKHDDEIKTTFTLFLGILTVKKLTTVDYKLTA